jgi:hypothetical protein
MPNLIQNGASDFLTIKVRRKKSIFQSGSIILVMNKHEGDFH